MLKSYHTRKLMIIALVPGLWALSIVCLYALGVGLVHADQSKTVEFDEITVKRLNVVSETGEPRIVISNATRFPSPVIKGKVVHRSINPDGILFYDQNGNEVGGIGASPISEGRQVATILDYRNSDAIGFGTRDNDDGYAASFFVRDRVPLNTDITKSGSAGQTRISIKNEDGNASITLRDPDGNNRIVLMVDNDGKASLEMLNSDGSVVFRIPKRNQKK